MEETKNTSPELTDGPGKQKIYFTAEVVIGFFLMLYGLMGFFALGGYRFIFAAVCGAVLGSQGLRYRKAGYKKELPKRILLVIIVLTVVLAVCVAVAPVSVRSSSKFKFGIQRSYINSYQTVSDVSWIPEEEVRKAEGDYRLDYMASFGQGTGHFDVRFTTGKDSAKAMAEEYGRKAVYTVELKDYESSSGSYYHVNGGESDKDILTVFYDRDIWEGHTDSAVIYVLSATLNWNHPHCQAVIIDPVSGLAEFSQLG
ncbi:MAG: hypothetical protein IJ806_10760 [Ruminococcus sp.]|nr:hypothetical protein [Ruminococcus sp.]